VEREGEKTAALEFVGKKYKGEKGISCGKKWKKVCAKRGRKRHLWVGPTQPQTKSISEATNRHGFHTAAKSEISGHIYSNTYILLNSRTNECFTLTELLRSN
jgi:hypothetical protein